MITVPTLIISHREDGCADTPAADAALLRTRLTTTRSAHGYFGIEAEAVDTIANFIDSNSS
jgi:hypothetical protein